MKILSRIGCFMVLGTLLVVAGCGYTTRAYIGPYKTIYIAPFKNSVDITKSQTEYNRYTAYYPLLESTITQETSNRFILDGNLKIAKEENADLVLRGELTSYNRSALRYSTANNEDVTEYRISLYVNFSLVNSKTGKVVLEKNNFVGESTYFTSGSQVKSEKAALDDAITDLGRRIVEAVVEQW